MLEAGVGIIETMAMEARGDATVALRMSGTNLSLHQERQLSDSQLCVVMKGVRPINKEGREIQGHDGGIRECNGGD